MRGRVSIRHLHHDHCSPIRQRRKARSDFFPGPLGDGIAAFIKLDVVDEGLDRFSDKAALLDARREDLAAFVAPPKLGDEAIPDVALFVGARGAVGVRPLQDGVVGLAGERAAFELGVSTPRKRQQRPSRVKNCASPRYSW